MTAIVSPDMLGHWQRRLRLADWHIAISDMEPEVDDRSDINMDVPIRQAVIRFRSDTLLHALFAGMRDAYDAARSYAPSTHDETARRFWDRGCEFAIEALCDALTGTKRADWGPSGSPWNEAFPAESPPDAGLTREV